MKPGLFEPGTVKMNRSGGQNIEPRESHRFPKNIQKRSVLRVDRFAMDQGRGNAPNDPSFHHALSGLGIRRIVRDDFMKIKEKC